MYISLCSLTHYSVEPRIFRCSASPYLNNSFLKDFVVSEVFNVFLKSIMLSVSIWDFLLASPRPIPTVVSGSGSLLYTSVQHPII